jgi:DNA invertase Pin-like site-specific DNA recombinase
MQFNRSQISELVREVIKENFKDGKVKGKSKPGRVKKSGASCNGSVTSLRAKAKKYGGEKGKMYHWCANMKSSKKNESNQK